LGLGGYVLGLGLGLGLGLVFLLFISHSKNIPAALTENWKSFRSIYIFVL
jgi:hypothetical protein